MWLLDANLPIKLIKLLKDFGITAETAEYRGWKELSNGQLVSTASNAGFKCILTRDREFAASAGRALTQFPKVSIIVIRLDQVREKFYFDSFKAAWKVKPIEPKPGAVLEWPA